MAGEALGDVPVIFNSVIEGFARTYGQRLTPGVRRELATLGVRDASVELLDKDFGTQSARYRIRWNG